MYFGLPLHVYLGGAGLGVSFITKLGEGKKKIGGDCPNIAVYYDFNQQQNKDPNFSNTGKLAVFGLKVE